MGSPLYALANSVVLRSWTTPDPACGIGLTLQAFDGQVWTYCHLSVLDANVVAGAQLTAGEAVGLVGATGDATGPHLHLQLQPPTEWPQQTAWFQAFAGKAFTWSDGDPLANSRALSFVPSAARRRGRRSRFPGRFAPGSVARRRLLQPRSRSLGMEPNLPTRRVMAPRLRAHLPRVAFFVLLGLAATATLDLCRGTPARLDASRLDHGRSGTAARRPRRAQSGLRLRERNARGRRVRVARPRLRARLRREYRCRAVSGGRHARSRYRRTAHHTDLEAQLGVFADR